MKKIIKCTLAFLLCLAQVFVYTDTISAAGETQSKDHVYYSYTGEEIEKSISSITRDSYWGQHIFVSDANEQGAKVEWEKAERNMRVEIPKQISLNGAHGVFSDLEVSGNSKLAFMVTKQQQYSDYVMSTTHNVLAFLPFALAIDFQTGTVTCYTSKAFTTVDSSMPAHVVHQSDNLKAENLAGKQWEIRFNKLDDGDDDDNNDKWKIILAGEEFTVPESYIMLASAEMDLTRCYFGVNCWDTGGNTLSVVINSFHSGENACADDPANESLLQAAADTVKYIDQVTEITYDMGTEINKMYTEYKNMSPAMQSMITNSSRLEDIYSVYRVIEKIHDIGEVKLSSKETLDFTYNLYAGLSDELKAEVSNFEEFTVAQEKYLKLKLAEETSGSEDATAREEVNYIYKDRVTTVKLDDVTETKKVDGGMETVKVSKDVITEGSDGTQYLWIVFTVAGAVLLLVAGTFLLLHLKDKRKGL